MTEQEIHDRYLGCLTGLAIGDALGAPLEFMPRTEIATAYGEVREMLGGGWLNLEPGETTDGTQLALLITASLLEHGAVIPADLAARLVGWLASDPIDAGNITRAAIEQLARGVPWQDAGECVLKAFAGPVAGNGSVVRCAPLGLFLVRQPVAMVAASKQVAAITHAHPYSQWGAVAVNLAIAALLQGETADLYEQIASQLPAGEVAETIRRAPTLQRRDVRSGGYILETLEAAFWALAQSTTYEGVLIAAVNLGNAADAVGAVAGALAGARDGLSAIPDRWLRQLHEGREIVDQAHQLYLRAGGKQLALA